MDVVIEHLKELGMIILIMAYAWGGTIGLLKLIKRIQGGEFKNSRIAKKL